MAIVRFSATAATFHSVDRHQNHTPSLPACAIVGAGRLGNALAGALRAAGLSVDGPLGRGADGSGADVVLLCVPDTEIPGAAGAIAPGPLVGHCSGATGPRRRSAIARPSRCTRS